MKIHIQSSITVIAILLTTSTIMYSIVADAADNEGFTMKRIVICLDGTWNNPATEKETAEHDKVFKPTNVVKTCRSIPTIAKDKTTQISYYDIGVGGLRKYPGGWNTTHRIVDNVFGGARGSGYEGNVEDAYRFLAQNYDPDDPIYIFGFSRGAATARTLTQFIDWAGGLFAKGCIYWLPRFFDSFLEHKGQRPFGEERALARADTERLWKDKYNNELSPEELKEKTDQVMCVVNDEDRMIRKAQITYLGLWDTVLSVGREKRNFYVQPIPEKNIGAIRHALAIDESRYDFIPHIYTSPSPKNKSQKLEQKWFPGVHSNVGGGYVDDGLANHALHWVLAGAIEHELDLGDNFLNFYRPYAQDRLYKSRKWYWSLAELVRLRYKKGVRSMAPSHLDNQTAHLSVHPSAVERLGSCQNEEKQTHWELDQSYRPNNLLQHLASIDDLARYLENMFPDVTDPNNGYEVKYVSPKVLRERVKKIVEDPKRKDICEA